MSAALSRRRLLSVAGAGLSAGAAALAAGCGGGDADRARAQSESDVRLLNAALELEFVSVAAYERAADRLRGELGGLVRRFAAHDRVHADGLSERVRELGGRPREPQAARELPVPRGERAILAFAVDLEHAAIASYLDALPLATSRLRPTLASILTTQAEHVAVLREALGQEPVPLAFVDGRR